MSSEFLKKSLVPENEHPYKLPNGWLWVKMESICDVRDGTHDSPIYYETGFPLITSKNLKDGQLDFENVKYISKADLDLINIRSKVDIDDILYAMIGTIGNPVIVKDASSDKYAIKNVALFKPKNSIFPNFLYFYLKSSTYTGLIEKDLKGSTQKFIPLGKFRASVITLPPLPEQKRIVGKLDSLLGKIKEAKALISEAKESFANRRSAILHKAFTGELTANWRAENQTEMTGCELITSVIAAKKKILSNKKAQKLSKLEKNSINIEYQKNNMVSTWATVKLDNLVYISARIGWKGLKAEEYTKEGPLFLSVRSLNYGYQVVYNEAYHISNERFEESPEIMLQNDDILLCKDGAGIGKIGIVKNLNEKCTVNSSLLVVRPQEAFIPEFLFYFFLGNEFQKIVKERITGSAIPHLFQRDIKEFLLPLPPLSEQKEIVRRIDDLLKAETEAKELLEMDEQLDLIEKAVLSKAFRGELDTQDASDEPAVELLKRLSEEVGNKKRK